MSDARFKIARLHILQSEAIVRSRPKRRTPNAKRQTILVACHRSRREHGIVSEAEQRKSLFDSAPTTDDRTRTVLATLRRLRRPAPTEERCELCAVGLASHHRHLLEMSNARIVCACDPCALRFQDVAGGRFKLIPREVRLLAHFQLTDTEWDSLALPINLAFFFYSTPQGKVKAVYPSPAGATESLLPLPAGKSSYQITPRWPR